MTVPTKADTTEIRRTIALTEQRLRSSPSFDRLCDSLEALTAEQPAAGAYGARLLLRALEERQRRVEARQ